MKSPFTAKCITCIICGKDEYSVDNMVKHLAKNHSYKHREFFQLEWMIAEHCYEDQTEVRCALSDSTIVGHYSWAELKPETMMNTFTRSSWYQILSDEDRELLFDLRRA